MPSTITSFMRDSSEMNKVSSYLDTLLDFRRNQQLKKIRFSDYEVIRVLQKGEKNEVLLCRHRKHTTQGTVVIKKLDNKKNKLNFIQNEINAGRKIKHSSCVKMIHTWTENDSTYILFEHIDGKDLYDFLADNDFEPLAEFQAKEVFRQIVKALKQVHKAGFVHGDLKLENIMLERKTSTIKLIDFGFATPSSCKSQLSCWQGSVEYLAPEVLLRKPYLPCKAEVWSLGVILFTLVFGEFPFSEHERNSDFEGAKVNFPNTRVSSHARDLISRMLDINPENRPDVESIPEDAWFDQ